MRAFEIHTFTGGKWKIDSVFDDRELAVFEAQRIDESSRYAGVRVVEENFDEQTQMSTARTIFRGGRVENEANRRLPLPKKRPPGAAARRGGAAGRPRGGEARKAAKSNTALVVMLSIILVGGLAALAALHILPRFI